ncbi:MAG TPA: toll/interleukin-1 receptor domain-containing protein [Verrucomicrobiae bacterium]|nr:toll/interleukin-1 receptor domain-containing protein [Verrucomicrobiae bacterium]
MTAPDADIPVDFFISYNAADKLWADGLGNWLDQALFTSVSQSQDFVAGSNFVSEMNTALQRARRVLAIVSPDYFAARFPEAEWTAAFARDPTGSQRTLILVRVRECEIPPLLRPLVYIDLCGLSVAHAQEKFITEIMATLASRRAPRRRKSPSVSGPMTGAQPGGGVHQVASGNRNVQVGRDYIRTEKHTTRNVIQPGPEHITDEQAAQIKAMIDGLAEIDVAAGRPDSHGKWYSRLYRMFPCRNSYHLIYREDFPAVMADLRREAVKARPKLRRTNNQEWRRRHTRAIWARARRLGLSHDKVHQLATERLGLKKALRSLNELGEQNLERFYRIIMNLRD